MDHAVARRGTGTDVPTAADRRTGRRRVDHAETGTIAFQGVDVFVRAVGSGPPVLLVNGLGAHTAMWDHLERTFAGFRLLQFDLPGAGQSGVPRWPVSIRDLATLATRVMDRFGVEQADVLGYSMGGIVSQQLAYDHPDRVRRVVLLATTPGRGAFSGDPKAMLNIISPVRYLSPALYAKTIGTLVGGRARHDAAWVAEQGLLRLKYAPTWRGYFNQLASMSRWSALAILPRIEHDVLVVAGDDDPLVPVVNAMLLTHLLPNARLLLARNEGHLMMMDADSRTHARMHEFLAADDLTATRVWDVAQPVGAGELRIALAGASALALPWGRDARMRRKHLRAAPG